MGDTFTEDTRELICLLHVEPPASCSLWHQHNVQNPDVRNKQKLLMILVSVLS